MSSLDRINELTPVERHGGFMLKRDDTFEVNGVRGSKVRAALYMGHKAQEAGYTSLMVVAARQSPQPAVVSAVAQHLGMYCTVMVPKSKKLTPELQFALDKRAMVETARATFLSSAARQVRNIKGLRGVKRIVVPVGSGISCSGVISGMRRFGIDLPVLGVMMGRDPSGVLHRFVPGWGEQCKLVDSGIAYKEPAPVTKIGGVQLDPIYEAKCLPFLKKGDLLWVVGIRPTI